MAGEWLKRKINNTQKKFTGIPYELRRWYNKKRIKSRDFTIISNNCWAGKVYQYFDMPYLSPTVGLYFFAEDYLKFISDLHYYFSLELNFISADKSKYRDILIQRKHTNVPIAHLGDIEIIFLHYHSEEEVQEKWERRKKRVNYDNIFIKFSKMNLCTEDDIEKFSVLPFQNKFVLNTCKKTKYSCEYYWSGRSNDLEILSDTNPFPGNLSLSQLLSKKSEHYPDSGLC